MTIAQVCLIIALNLLAGTFLAWHQRPRSSASGGLLLLAMILLGFALMWRSLP
ncbi:hypothetical protein [Methylobacterium durans]|uniref:hypothetical protein n=1 Tax=Methylobacterium durans TaxID=2202825 RepID=UPI0013A58E46|nr:hypothetical protein [Methylobacterium durans]